MQQLAKFRPGVKVRYTVLNSVSRNLVAFKIFKVSGGCAERRLLIYFYSTKWNASFAYVIHRLVWTLPSSQKFLDDNSQTVKDFFKAMDTEGKKEVPTSVFRKALKVRSGSGSLLITSTHKQSMQRLQNATE